MTLKRDALRFPALRWLHQGSVRYLQVCTRCLRSGLVVKPA